MEDKLPLPADCEAAAVLIVRDMESAMGRCWHAGRVNLIVGRTNGSMDRTNDMEVYIESEFDK